jgi:Tfp pilus assembly protein PilN
MAPLDYKATEFVLLVLGAVMTLAALVVGILLYRLAVREHRAQLEREKREAAPARAKDGHA